MCNITESLIKLREEKGMTQTELADASGIDCINISKIEDGLYGISVIDLCKMVTALEGSVEVLSGEEALAVQNIRRYNKAKAVFTYYDAESSNINIFGEWAVNECGDIINYVKNYPLYNYNLMSYNHDEDEALIYWSRHIGEKYDFDVKHFAKAFKYALPLANKQKQVKVEL